jgi:hypothetical protein
MHVVDEWVKKDCFSDEDIHMQYLEDAIRQSCLFKCSRESISARECLWSLLQNDAVACQDCRKYSINSNEI